ncbi:MAG: hypothetical protein FWE59_04640 [Oscillospiraceae bacterium]|nr:hypothetical protein [Oscillospiraceae bacterium]
MKHPVKFFAVLFLVLAAVAAAILMTMRYMDVLQKQFDFLRGLLARRHGGATRDGDFSDEYGDASEEESVEDFVGNEFSDEEADDEEELKF